MGVCVCVAGGVCGASASHKLRRHSTPDVGTEQAAVYPGRGGEAPVDRRRNRRFADDRRRPRQRDRATTGRGRGGLVTVLKSRGTETPAARPRDDGPATSRTPRPTRRPSPVSWFLSTGWAKKVKPQTRGHNSVKC